MPLRSIFKTFTAALFFGAFSLGTAAVADPIRMPTEAELQQAREELAEIRAREIAARPTPAPTAISAPVPSPAPPPAEAIYGGPSFVIQRTCASPCQMREASGKCLASGAENCGPGYACAPRCISRNSAGKCMAYGADYCAAGASCSPTCLFYAPGKVCSAYDSDTCTQNIVGTR